MIIHKPLLQKRNARAKRLILKYDDKAEQFVMTIPNRASKTDIDRFLETSKSWMESQLKVMKPRIQFIPGQVINILGHKVTLVHTPFCTAKSTAASKTGYKAGSEAKPVIKTADSLVVNAPIDVFDRHVTKYLKSHAMSIFQAWCNDIAQGLPRSLLKKPKLKSLTIKDTKSRWGSCSSRGDICLSWRLLFAPQAVAKYVCIHECCHLIEMNHSAKFWALVQDIDPDFTIHKLWLKTNGRDLFLYGSL